VASSPDAFVGIDDLGRITDWNPAAERLFGWSSLEAQGQTMAGLIIPERYRLAHGAMGHLLDPENQPAMQSKVLEIVAKDRDGHEFPVELALSAALVQGRIWFNAFIRDTTKHKEMGSQLRQQALVDSLTGLPNRALLTDRLAGAITRIDGGTGGLALLFINLDRFKVINDGLGNSAGDQVLIEVAHRIGSGLRDSDTLARYGGDEFVVVCEAISSSHPAIVLAQRISQTISRPINLVERSVVVTASIGIALLDGSGGSAEDLLRYADAAMYQAKQCGGHGHALFDASRRRHGLARLDIEIALTWIIHP
jgi:diguanylate cyclase (GGDEF)-like protein/PAS domain S-box-containing protein